MGSSRSGGGRGGRRGVGGVPARPRRRGRRLRGGRPAPPPPPPPPPGPGGGRAPRRSRAPGGAGARGALARLTVRAQRYAPGAHTVRLAPGVRAGVLTGEDRWRELEGITAFAWPYGSWAGLITGLETAHLLALTAGVLVAPVP